MPKYKKHVEMNYQHISLLKNMEKCLERAVYKYLYNNFRDNDVLTSFQSGFIPGDSTVNQLTFLYDTFCQAIYDEKEVRVVFCDVSKVFDRVWHAGLIHKLKAAGITGQLYWFASYLKNRRQRVVISGVQSDLVYISAGVPQGSILGPLLFLLYINDIVNDIGCNIRLFATTQAIPKKSHHPILASSNYGISDSRIFFLSLLKILTLQLNLLIQTWVKYKYGLENGYSNLTPVKINHL